MSDTPISDAYWTKRYMQKDCMSEGEFARTLERELTEARKDLLVFKEVANNRSATITHYHEESLSFQAQLAAHKEALEKCRMALLGYLDVLPSRELHESLAAIAKCKEGPTAADDFMEGQP